VRSLLVYPAVGQDDNQVGVGYRGEPVSDQHRDRAPAAGPGGCRVALIQRVFGGGRPGWRWVRRHPFQQNRSGRSPSPLRAVDEREQ
jgi:hypothetical protein